MTTILFLVLERCSIPLPVSGIECQVKIKLNLTSRNKTKRITLLRWQIPSVMADVCHYLRRFFLVILSFSRQTCLSMLPRTLDGNRIEQDKLLCLRLFISCCYSKTFKLFLFFYDRSLIYRPSTMKYHWIGYYYHYNGQYNKK